MCSWDFCTVCVAVSMHFRYELHDLLYCSTVQGLPYLTYDLCYWWWNVLLAAQHAVFTTKWSGLIVFSHSSTLFPSSLLFGEIQGFIFHKTKGDYSFWCLCPNVSLINIPVLLAKWSVSLTSDREVPGSIPTGSRFFCAVTVQGTHGLAWG